MEEYEGGVNPRLVYQSLLKEKRNFEYFLLSNIKSFLRVQIVTRKAR